MSIDVTIFVGVKETLKNVGVVTTTAFVDPSLRP
jgi:hypothetical protein